MDFTDSPSDAEFRAELRAWLAAHATARTGEPTGFGALVAQGDDEAALVAHARDWQRALHAGGWAAIHWPREAGGRGATPMQAYIYAQELAAYDVPLDIFSIGLGMVGPTLIAWGTPEQKERYLQPMLEGSEIWCQLWSEPDAGSDVAALRTRAERDEATGRWVINGQKIWTSGAQWCRYGLAIVRTDPTVPKHKGISAFIIDMQAPGVDVRPLREMSGGTTFNEVFFTDVVVEADALVGPVNQGWQVALTTLAHERFTAGLIGITAMAVEPLLSLATQPMSGTPAAADPLVRDRLAEVYTRHKALTLTIFRTLTAIERGQLPGPEGSTLKLAWSRLATMEAELAMSILGPTGLLTGPSAPRGGEWATAFSFAPSYHLGGGTDEVQKTILGERVLGLPKEPAAPQQVATAARG